MRRIPLRTRILGAGLGALALVTASWAGPAGAASVPVAVTINSVTPGPAPGEMTVRWAPTGSGGSPITEFRYERRIDGEADWSAPATVTPSGTRVAQLPCPATDPLVGCSFRMHAVNAIGAGAPGPEVHGAWDVPTPPRNARNGIIEAGAGLGITVAGAAWDEPRSTGGFPILTYELLFCVGYCPDDAPVWDTITPYAVGLRRTAPMVCPNASESCYLRVRAVTAVGAGPWSNPTYMAPFATLDVTALPSSIMQTPGQVLVFWRGPREVGLGLAGFQLLTCRWVDNCALGSSWSDTGIALGPDARFALHDCGPTVCLYRVRVLEAGGRRGVISALAAAPGWTPPAP